MAGSIVATQTAVSLGLAGEAAVAAGIRNVVKTSLAWTSDASGNVSAVPTTLPSGTIILVEFIPGAGGVQPTDLYDVTMTNAAGVNVLDNGAGTSIGANLSNATAARKVPLVTGAANNFVRMWLEGGAHTLVVAAAGNAKQGTVVIYQCLDLL